jgi:hypothetical protein
MLAVLALVVLGWSINRLAGVPYPLWGPRQAPMDIRPGGWDDPPTSSGGA